MVDRIDLPMRAFAEGYYENLIRMYKHLGVQFRSQPFLYSFGKDLGDEFENRSNKETYFIHSSNNHRIPPVRPSGVDLLVWLGRIIYVAFFYLWWTICCVLFPPHPASRTDHCETLGAYVDRIKLPSTFVNYYLMPLISSVSTCTHKELLQFPAKDVTDYKLKSAGKKHYTVAGVHAVQNKLGEVFDRNLSATVTGVESLVGGKVQVTWIEPGKFAQMGTYDHVILAVAPDVVGKLFKPLESAMNKIPSTIVTSFVTGNDIAVSKDPKGIEKIDLRAKRGVREAQTINFRTSVSLGLTESHHVHPSGAIVTTCPLRGMGSQEGILRSAQFRRALRTPLSRHVVNKLFDEGNSHDLVDEKSLSWRNGDNNVWLVGGWCWDGMVLLEGCVVSAMRVARDLDVDVPWSP